MLVETLCTAYQRDYIYLDLPSDLNGKTFFWCCNCKEVWFDPVLDRGELFDGHFQATFDNIERNRQYVTIYKKMVFDLYGVHLT